MIAQPMPRNGRRVAPFKSENVLGEKSQFFFNYRAVKCFFVSLSLGKTYPGKKVGSISYPYEFKWVLKKLEHKSS